MATINRAVREIKLSWGPTTPLLPKRIAASNDVVAFLKEELGSSLNEHFIVIVLTTRQHVLGWGTVGVGSMAACPVCPADVMRFAVMTGGAALVLAHNHPSGDSNPSPEDLTLTQRLVKAGEVLGIKILDHVIVGDNEFFSFLDKGLMHHR